MMSSLTLNSMKMICLSFRVLFTPSTILDPCCFCNHIHTTINMCGGEERDMYCSLLITSFVSKSLCVQLLRPVCELALSSLLNYLNITPIQAWHTVPTAINYFSCQLTSWVVENTFSVLCDLQSLSQGQACRSVAVTLVGVIIFM
jgi:hypothetical protein